MLLRFETLSLFILSLFAAVTTFNSGQLLIRLTVFILISISVEYIFTEYYKPEEKFNSHNLSLAIIIFLLTDKNMILFLPIFALVIAHFSLHLLGKDGRIIFNPITFSLFLMGFFGLNISWWGINTGLFLIFIMILAGGIKTFIARNIKAVLIFLASVVFFGYIFTFNILFSIKQLFIPGFLFFALYLLFKNPSINNNSEKLKIIYAITVSFIAVIITKFGLSLDPLISSLVITDSAFFVLEKLNPPGVTAKGS
jgi:hypothetical protein